MSTKTMQDRHRSAEDRLAALGRRIDDVRGSARGDREKVNRSIERRLDAVRAKDAEIRTDLRQMAEEDDAVWRAYFDELDRELDELDAEVVVMESQIAASEAEDWNAFERATQEELEAYDRLLESSRQRVARAKVDVLRRSTEAADRAREKVQTAGDALRRGRAGAARGWASTRDEIRTEMDEVDAAVIDAVAYFEGQIMDGSSDRER
jgi:DNA repair exonuclease SbcCD ATPase subunit